MSQPDYILDIASLRRPAPQDDAAQPPSADEAIHRDRPWLAIHWRCCSVYSRVYRRHDAPAYEARCPRCARHLRIAVAEGGTDARFFEAF